MKMNLNEALERLKNAGLIVEGDVSADNIRRSLLKSFKDYGWNKNEDQYSFEINVSSEEVKVQAKAYLTGANARMLEIRQLILFGICKETNAA